MNGELFRRNACSPIRMQANPEFAKTCTDDLAPSPPEPPVAEAVRCALTSWPILFEVSSCLPGPYYAEAHLRDDRSKEEEEYQQPEETRPGMNHVDESDEDTCYDSRRSELILRGGIGDQASRSCDFRYVCFCKC